MKRIVLAAMMGALCTMASAADRAGLAQSRETFDVMRDAVALPQRANTLNEIQPGDVIKAGLSKVTVNTTDQGSILLNEESSIEFTEDGNLRLLEGAAVFHLPEGTARVVRYDDLVMTTIQPPRTAGSSHVVLVSSTTDGRVQVQSIREAFAIAQEGAENRLATLGDGDLLIFGRNDQGGWSVIDPDQGAPSRFRLAQDATEAPPDEEDEEDRRRGAWWVTGGIVLLSAAAAGGLGYVIVNELDDDDDDDDDDEEIDERPRPRPPVSPTRPPDDEYNPTNGIGGPYFDDEYYNGNV
jgi:hypothetical protein